MEKFSLHRACEEGNIVQVKFLLQNGEDVNRRDEFKRTPLHCAANRLYGLNTHNLINIFTNNDKSCTKYEIAELLLKNGADSNIIGHNMSGVTPLHFAVLNSDYNLVNLLLKYKANPIYRCLEGKTPLHYSVRQNCLEITKKIIEFGCPINSVNLNGETPLHEAVTCQSQDKTIQFLIENNAIIDWKDCKFRTPLHLSIINKNINATKILLNYGANVRSTDDEGLTPLHYAVMSCDPSFVKLILTFNADINAQNKKGNTPLHFAVSKYDVNILEILLKKSANPNITNTYRQSPLSLALMQGRLKSSIIALLLDYGSDITLTNVVNKSILKLANNLPNDSTVKDIVIKHALKLIAANLIPFNDEINQLIKNNQCFYDQCLNEINFLKENKLFNILILPIDKLIHVFYDGKEFEKLPTYYSDYLPIYKKMIKKKLKRVWSRKKLFKNSENCLETFFSFSDSNLPRIPPECFAFILDNFSNRDLKMFINFVLSMNKVNKDGKK